VHGRGSHPKLEGVIVPVESAELLREAIIAKNQVRHVADAAHADVLMCMCVRARRIKMRRRARRR
jgi:hypothetical protein